jgi:hypothetical protein
MWDQYLNDWRVTFIEREFFFVLEIKDFHIINRYQATRDCEVIFLERIRQELLIILKKKKNID